MVDKRPALSLQESVLALLCFSEHATMLRGIVEADLFETDYDTIARAAFIYIDKFGKAPGLHVVDELEETLRQGREGAYIKDLLLRLRRNTKEINVEYVISRVTSFVRTQRLKRGIIEAADLLQQGKVDADTKAEAILLKAMKSSLSLFDPGLRLTDARALQFLERTEPEIKTGILEFDKRGMVPCRKELFLFVAPMKRGKTWALTHFGKMALMQRLKVCHITLEVDQYRMAQRYFQAFFAIATKSGELQRTIIKKSMDGGLMDLKFDVFQPWLSCEDHDVQERLAKKIPRYERFMRRLMIKQFPTGSLTVSALNSYLDALESAEKFTPDVIILDYPDLMDVNPNQYRIELGTIYKGIRGIAVERNAALITASQSTRGSLSSQKITEDQIAEDISKVATSDNVVTYSQTQDERRLGLARLYAAAARNIEDKFTVLITQNYATGQFAMDSITLDHDHKDDYWKFIDKHGREDGEDEEGNDNDKQGDLPI